MSKITAAGSDGSVGAPLIGKAPNAAGRTEASPLLVDADDEVTLADLGARHTHFLRRVQLLQHQIVALPAQELLDQHRLALLVHDDVASAGRRLERVDM